MMIDRRHGWRLSDSWFAALLNRKSQRIIDVGDLFLLPQRPSIVDLMLGRLRLGKPFRRR